MSNEIEGAMPPLPEPKVLRLVDNEGFSDEAPYIWGFFAHGYDTGMEPYFSDDQMQAYAQAYAAPLIARVAELQEERDRIERNRDMWKSQCAQQAEKLTTFHATVPAMEIDAKRYRHMRDLPIERTGMPGQPCVAMPNGMQSGYYLTEETADFAIDAAIAAKD